MKKFFLFFPLLCLPFLSSAQLGLKAGVNASVADVEDRDVQWENEGLGLGIHAGLFGRLNLWKLYLQPELYYTFSKAQLSKNSVDVATMDVDFHRLDLPVLLGARLGESLRIHGGPFASVNIRTSSSDAERQWNEEIDDYYSRTSFGWQAGVGVDFWRFSLDGRYETTVGNLREFDFENSQLSDYLPDEQAHRQFILSLGYTFGKRR